MPIDPITGLYKAVPGSALMSEDDTTQLSLDPAAGSAPVDPRMYNSIFASRLADEAARRGLDTSRLGSLLQDPLANQRQQVEAMNAADQAAIRQGYPGGDVIKTGSDSYMARALPPTQQMAQAQRASALAEKRIPLEQTQATQAGETERARLAAEQGPLRVEEAKEKGATQRAKDFLNMLKDLQLPEGGEVDLPGGGKLRRGATPLPTGTEEQKNLDKLIANRTSLEHPVFSSYGSLGRMFGQSVDQQKAALEQQLDSLFPAWRSRVAANNPGFKFVTGAGVQAQPVSATGLRQRAISALQTQAKIANPSEAQIQAAMQQLQ